ncbi:MAG: hypothetical protein ABI811_21335 [Acidobacteriota bacterium]
MSWKAIAIALGSILLLLGIALRLAGQAPKPTPDISGVWSPSRATGPNAPPAPTPITLKPAYKPAYDARRAAERAANERGEQLASAGLCSPYGMPTMMTVAVYPMEAIQTPKQITFVTEAFSEVRRVYIGKAQLPIDDVAPGYYGRSVGRWDGDTLVVDTVGIKEIVRGYQGLPHSDQLRITERIHRVGADLLYDQITLDDPVVLEKPVTYTLVFKQVPDYEMVEFVCDNNREYVDEKGVVRMRLREK